MKSNFACEMIGNKVYCIGGRVKTGTSYALTDTIYVYELDNGQWSLAESRYPSPIMHAGSTSIGHMIYCVGGYLSTTGSQTNKCYRYNTSNGQWTQLENLPANLGNLLCFSHNGLIYAVGGYAGTSAYDTIYVYDPETDHWTKLDSTLPIKNSNFGFVKTDHALYFTGGYGGVAAATQINDFHIYHVGMKITERFQTVDGAEIQPDQTVLIEGEDGYSCEAAAIPGYSYIGYRIDDGNLMAGTSVTIHTDSEYLFHDSEYTVTYIYRAGANESVEGDRCCCCGELDVHLRLPISNNLEVLKELNDLIPKIKGCDNSDCHNY